MAGLRQCRIDQLASDLAHLELVRLQRLLRPLVDDRPDVCSIGHGIADAELGDGSCQKRDGAVGHISVHEQHTRGRAALPRAVEGRADTVAYDLLGHRAAVGDHGVEPAGLSDERHDRPPDAGARRLDRPGRLVRASECDAADARIPHKPGARASISWQQVKNALGDPSLVQELNGLERRQWRLPGGLGHDAVAGRERCGDLTHENGERKIPGADARENAAPLQP